MSRVCHNKLDCALKKIKDHFEDVWLITSWLIFDECKKEGKSRKMEMEKSIANIIPTCKCKYIQKILSFFLEIFRTIFYIFFRAELEIREKSSKKIFKLCPLFFLHLIGTKNKNEKRIEKKNHFIIFPSQKKGKIVV